MTIASSRATSSASSARSPPLGEQEAVALVVRQTTAAPLSTKESDGGLDAEAALLGSTGLASDGRSEDGEQLESGVRLIPQSHQSL